MTDAASWAIVAPMSDDNAYAREQPSELTENYAVPVNEGLATVRKLGKATIPESEPLAVWVLVVGGIAFLVLLAKTFKTAKA